MKKTLLRYIATLTSMMVATFASMPAYAGFQQFMDDTSRSADSFLHSAGQFAIGGGVIILAIVGLITAIALIFTLLMMLKR